MMSYRGVGGAVMSYRGVGGAVMSYSTAFVCAQGAYMIYGIQNTFHLLNAELKHLSDLLV